MKQLLLSQSACLLCFWFGFFILLSLALAARRTFTVYRSARRLRVELDALLNQRRRRLGESFIGDTTMRQACHDAEDAVTDAEFFAAEQELTRLVGEYLSDTAAKKAGHLSHETVKEILEIENRVVTAQDLYNESVQIVFWERSGTLTGLFARSFYAADLLPFSEIR